MLTHSADEIALCGKPFLLPAHPTLRKTPPHPATLSMVQKKIKHKSICLPCACGRFILFIHLFRYIPFHCIPLHPFIAFISPTSAPHSKSNSFPSFRKPVHRLSVSWHPDYPHTNASHIRDCSCHYKPAKSFAPLRSVIAFALPHHTMTVVCFIFFCGILPQPETEIRVLKNSVVPI